MLKRMMRKSFAMLLSVIILCSSMPITALSSGSGTVTAVASWMTGYKNLSNFCATLNSDPSHSIIYNGQEDYSINAWVIPVPSFNSSSNRITDASISFAIQKQAASQSEITFDFYVLNLGDLQSLSNNFNYVTGSNNVTDGYFTRTIDYNTTKANLNMTSLNRIGSYTRSTTASNSTQTITIDGKLVAGKMNSLNGSGHLVIAAAARTDVVSNAATFFGKSMSVTYTLGGANEIAWKSIASTDFTKGATLTNQGLNSTLVNQMNVPGSCSYIGSGFSKVNDDDKVLNWNIVNYGTNSYPIVDEGIKIGNGYAYIADCQGSSPISNYSSFKIVYEFDASQTTQNFANDNTAYALIKLWNYSEGYPHKNGSTGITGEAANSNVFTQYCNYGKAYVGTQSVGKNPSDFLFRVNGYKKYEVEYNASTQRLTARIYNDSTSVLLIDTNVAINTSAITAISLGDPDDAFVLGMKMKKISFYASAEEMLSSSPQAVLTNAMTQYQNKLSSGSYFTNMEAAYNAYVNCQKAYDAITYGNAPINARAYANALTTAIGNMRAWTAPSGSTIPMFSDVDVSNPNTAQNCLWAEINNDPVTYIYTRYNICANFFYHESVYMFDGYVKIPFMIGFYRANSSTGSPKNPRVWYANLTGQTGGLSVVNDTYTGDAYDSRNFRIIINSSYRISAKQNQNNSIILSTATTRYMANFFAISSMSSNSYYVQAYPNSFKMGYGNRDDSSYIETYDLQLGNSKNIYVLNYKVLHDYLDSATYANYFRNVASYKEGGLQSLMRAYDKAMAVNPTSYDYSSNTLSKVQTVANAIESAVNSFKALGTPATDSENYAALRRKLTEMENCENKQISNSNTSASRYTATSWNAYSSAYNAGVSAMANVINDAGYAANYNGSTIQQITSAIASAYSALKYNYIVRFENINGDLLTTTVAEEGSNTNGISVPNTPILSGTQGNKRHTVYSWQNVVLDRNNFGNAVFVTVNETGTQSNCTIVEDNVITPATCTTPQIKSAHCSVCFAEYSVEGQSLGHTYDSTVIAPTCTEQGYTHYVCSACGDEYNDNYTEVAPHSYILTVIAPTCTQRGYTAQKCTECGTEEIDENTYTDPLGHSYQYSVAQEPDCTFSGVGEYYCPLCNDVYTENIPTDSTIHSDLAYARTVEPTNTEQGYDVYYCTNLCGYWEKRNIVPSIQQSIEFADYLETYNFALQQVVTDFAPYTSESVQNYSSVIASARLQGDEAVAAASVEMLESVTRTIIEASALLRIKTCSFVVYVNLTDDSIRQITYQDGVGYGEVLTVSLDSDYGQSVEKWTVEQNGVTKKINLSDTQLDFVVTDDAVINAYMSDEEIQSDSNVSLVTILNKDNRVIGTVYVPNGYEIDVYNPVLSGVTAPNIPFYVFERWEIVSGNQIVNGDTVVKPTYTVGTEEGIV